MRWFVNIPKAAQITKTQQNEFLSLSATGSQNLDGVVNFWDYNHCTATNLHISIELRNNNQLTTTRFNWFLEQIQRLTDVSEFESFSWRDARRTINNSTVYT